MLQLTDLSLHRHGRQLLHSISLTAVPGELTILLGPNGSGKTTLFRALAGSWPLTSGEILWGGKPIHNLLPKERSLIISLVPQSPFCPFPFTVRQLVSMGRFAQGDYHAATGDTHHVTKALAQVDATHLADRLMTELSSGERQRVFLARSLATDCPVLLLDEPTSNLDIRHQLELWELLRELAKQGRTILCAAHDLVMAQRYGDVATVLRKGHLYSHGQLNTSLNEECLREVFGVDQFLRII